MIIRVDKKRHFVVVPIEIADDRRLSWGAKGLYLYLLSMPTDATTAAEVLEKSPDGKSAVLKFLKELSLAGLIDTGQLELF